MRLNRIPWTIFAILLFVFSGGTLFAQSDSTMSPTNNQYKEEWQAIDSLEREGLWRSALERVQSLYERAKVDNEPAQVIKTVIYRSKYQMNLSEDGLVEAIAQMEEEIPAADFPVKPVLQSMLGELYQNYLEQNAWRLGDRTQTEEYRSEDIQTWTIEQLSARAAALLEASLQYDNLKEVSIERFDAITTQSKNVEGLRPTLYDFLAHLAIDQFRNEQAYLTQPAFAFEIRDPAVFAEAAAFAGHSFETRDTGSYQYKALLLFQDLLRFHLNDESPAALIDADLKRLDFAREKAVMDRKDSLYLEALERLQNTYGEDAAVASVEYEIAQWHYRLGEEYDPFQRPEPQWELKTAMEICQSVIRRFPDSYGAQQCRGLLANIHEISFEMQVEEVNVPGRSLLARLVYRNIDRARFRIVSLTENDFDSLQQKNTAEKIGYLLGKELEREWEVALPTLEDYQQHATEIGLDPLEPGSYALLSTTGETFSEEEGGSGLLFFYVSNIADLRRDAREAGTEFLVVHRETGTPLEGVLAEFYTTQYNRTTRRQEYRLAGSARSDVEGFIRPDVPEGNYYQVKFIRNRDTLFLRDGFSNYSRYYQERESMQKATHFFLDRAIYRPGQTVYFKGIALQHGGSGVPGILTDEPVTVTMYDVNRQPVAEMELQTNAYGTFQGSFRTPELGLRGQMSISSSIGNSSKEFRVEEYKRPRFEVTFASLEEDYDLGDEVEVQGTAKAYAGSNIDGALVQYRVVREVRFPWWPVWGRGRFFPPMRGARMEIANGSTTTDENGAFTVSFPAIPDPSVSREQNPAFSFTVYADVTDIAGETRTGEKQIQLAYLGLKASVDLPEQVDRSSSQAVGIRTTNLDGQPLQAVGTIKIYQMDAPERVLISRYWDRPDLYTLEEDAFRERFPHYPYKGEDEPQNWDRQEEVFSYFFNTDEEKEVQLDMNGWPVGQYELHLITTDSEGNPVEVKQFFTVYDSRQGEVPSNVLGWQQLEDKAYEPGEEAQLLLATGTEALRMRYEIERDREIVDGGWLEVREWTAMPYSIRETDRGNIHYHVTYVKYNRFYSWRQTVRVPWTNKELKIEYSTFRDKLRPGQEEEWRLKISGPAGEQVAAEMVASMYDASLDQFAPHSWSFQPYPFSYYAARGWSAPHFGLSQASYYRPYRGRTESSVRRQYRRLNWFDFFRYGGGRVQYRAMAEPQGEVMGVEVTAARDTAEESLEKKAQAPPPEPEPETPPTEEQPAEVQVRTNLAETVFFMPDLRTDGEGNIIISFTMNEALTRWKFLGMAHTKELEFALTEREIITQKELMVLPNAPRFVREGDEIEFVAKVSNLTEGILDGQATLQLFDGLTMEPIDALFENEQPEVPFEAGPGQSARVAWKLRIPEGKAQVVVHRVIARAGAYSDGEESAMPVLTNRTMVTESMPITVRGRERQTFTFERLEKMTQSPTLENHALTLEFTSNPAWFAVKALPYLMEYPHDCAEQIFSRLYANSLAGAVVQAHPRIEDVFQKWRDSEALESQLMRNPELKNILIEETPWVMQAQSEEQQRKNIALLFDLNRMGEERQAALRKLTEMQKPSGGFAWFPGGQENWFITQYIVEGMGRLRTLNIFDLASDQKAGAMVRDAVRFIDDRLEKSYQELKEQAEQGKVDLSEDHLHHLALHYLYARTFFPDIPREQGVEEAYTYFLKQAEEYWLDRGIYQQGLIAMAAHRADRAATADRIVRSLQERALMNEELGMYWKYNTGWFWYELPIETHALMIEVFAEVARDARAVEELRIWLLKNKQVTHWKTTKATAAAVYALLNEGEELAGDWLTDQELVKINFVELRKRTYRDKLETAENEAEAGTGYYKVAWEGDAVRPDMKEIRVKNPNRSIAWGSLHWQYFEDLDNITTYEETPLELKKQLFRRVPSDTGPQLEAVTPGTRLTPGDLLTVRLELRVDRTMEYIHMKDMRASGLEPVNVLSQYKWQGGLGYYESTGDAATHFFFDYLPRGTYVFEYPLRVSHQGDFSNGITTIQCMYAPEFNSHSEGIRIRVAAEEN